MKILQLTVHFPPNVGGVETHLWDLVTLLSKKGWQVFVLSYRPLSVKIDWKIYEKFGRLEIFRIPWIQNLFYKLISNPELEFLYLFPGLFIFTPIILLTKRQHIIHAHGIVAGFVAVVWGRIFNAKIIISTHSIYSFPKKGPYHNFAKFIFGNADRIFCLSKQSVKEIRELDIDDEKIKIFTYWIDLEKFSKQRDARLKFNWKEKFIVLFVGRLISEKGIKVLLESVKKWNKSIGLVFAGAGPLEGQINHEASINPRIHFLGRVNQESLPGIYSAADILIVPSTSEEGFGRVIIESLACGTPVIASNRGAIPEAMDKSVGKLIDINADSIKDTVEYFFKYSLKLKLLSRNSRKFTERRYSEKNGESIISSYSH